MGEFKLCSTVWIFEKYQIVFRNSNLESSKNSRSHCITRFYAVTVMINESSSVDQSLSAILNSLRLLCLGKSKYKRSNI